MMGNVFRLGWAVALQGDLVEARQLAEECLALARTLRDPPFEVNRPGSDGDSYP